MLRRVIGWFLPQAPPCAVLRLVPAPVLPELASLVPEPAPDEGDALCEPPVVPCASVPPCAPLAVLPPAPSAPFAGSSGWLASAAARAASSSAALRSAISFSYSATRLLAASKESTLMPSSLRRLAVPGCKSSRRHVGHAVEVIERESEDVAWNALVHGDFPILSHQIGGVGRQIVEPIGAPGDDGHQQKRQHDGRRAALARQLAAVLLGQTRDVHDDDGDVVVAAPAHGLVHQLSRATLGLAVVGEDLGDLVVFQHRGKAIGAQKQTVAGFHGDFERDPAGCAGRCPKRG